MEESRNEVEKRLAEEVEKQVTDWVTRPTKATVTSI
jgi:hypothetical protein